MSIKKYCQILPLGKRKGFTHDLKRDIVHIICPCVALKGSCSLKELRFWANVAEKYGFGTADVGRAAGAQGDNSHQRLPNNDRKRE
jgi:hypothetical protein